MGVKSLKYLSNSSKETIELGRKLGKLLSKGDAVSLIGNLGSGKTWFTKGIALGLDIDCDTVVTSPTFSLVNEYEGRCILYHMDLYRLESFSDVVLSGLEEYFHDENVVVVEWGGRFPDIFPEKRIEVKIDIVDKGKRRIIFSGYNSHSENILTQIMQ